MFRNTVLIAALAGSVSLVGCNATSDISTIIADVQKACGLVLTIESATNFLNNIGLGNIATIVTDACSVVPPAVHAAGLAKSKKAELLGVVPSPTCYGAINNVEVCGWIVTNEQFHHYKHLFRGAK